MGLGLHLQQLAVRTLPLTPWLRTWFLSPAGPFTIFFWAPSFKWGITIANIGDMRVPAENLSTPQQFVIMISGLIWCKYAFQIYPFSWNFLCVQAFMSLTGMYQLARKAKVYYAAKS